MALYPLSVSFFFKSNKPEIVLVEVRQEDLGIIKISWRRLAEGGISWAHHFSEFGNAPPNHWPGSSVLLHLLAGHNVTVLLVLPRPPRPPPTVQMAGCSLVRFLWCMLWWRTSSSERANFFWQLDQRQVNGFSPDGEGTNNKKWDKSLLESELHSRDVNWCFVGHEIKSAEPNEKSHWEQNVEVEK